MVSPLKNLFYIFFDLGFFHFCMNNSGDIRQEMISAMSEKKSFVPLF